MQSKLEKQRSVTALSVDAIRFYERRALLPKPDRTGGRFRLYTEDDLLRLQFIREMQSLGFSLNEIKQLLYLRAQGGSLFGSA